MEITLVKALLLTLVYSLSGSLLFGGINLYYMSGSPIIFGIPIGLIMGDVPTAVIMCATIQLPYLGITGSGGVMPSDPGIAAVVGTALAMSLGLSTEASLTLAIPIGFLGLALGYIGRIMTSYLVKKLEDYASEDRDDKFFLIVGILPRIISLVTYTLPLFLILYFGTDVIEPVIKLFPDNVMHALEVIGGLLPAVGFAIMLRVLGKGACLPYFFIGFVLTSYLELPIMPIAVLALCAAVIHVSIVHKGGDEGAKQIKAEPLEADNKSRVLSKKDVIVAWLRWQWLIEGCYTWERMQAPGFLFALAPALKKLYSNKEDRVEAYKRHLEFYNSEANWGCLAGGVALAMEEEKASSAGNISGEAISAVKAGLMGPLAGIGDTFDWGVLVPLAISIGLPLALKGNWLGSFIPLLISFVAMTGISYFLFMNGYKYGKQSISKFMRNGAINKLILIASIVGLCVLGSMSASYVVVSTPLVLTVGDISVALQTDVLDVIFNGILSLAAVVAGWQMLLHKKSVGFVMIAMIIVGFFGGLIGLL